MAAFHDNHVKLEGLRSDLDRYGITIKLPDPVITNPDLPVVTPDEPVDDGTWDCRYKQMDTCQGIKLQNSTPTGKEMCRVKITPECFDKTYQTYGWLDFWSFLFILPAVAACVFEEDFTYGLCVNSAAYVLNLKYLQNELGVRY